jgi:LIVCS family branched-chain amino acid:cation transporter
MFFGAGNLVFPLILGHVSGDTALAAAIGLCITAVLFPLLGCFAMLLFQGNPNSFFARLGRWPGLLVFFFLQLLLGPLGSNPRLITVSYAALKPYLPMGMSLGFFSLIACLCVLLLVLKKHRVVDLLGFILTPALLLPLALIITLGLISPPQAPEVTRGSISSFFNGMMIGYNTLDLIASFLFAPMILAQLQRQAEGLPPSQARSYVISEFMKAALIAGALLTIIYVGMVYVAACHLPYLSFSGPEEMLGAIALNTLGPFGAIVTAFTVAMACLTTGIALVSIFADYLHKDIFKERVRRIIPLLITLGVSGGLAILGFSEIARLLAPILELCYPALIILTVLNICYKLYGIDTVKIPVSSVAAVSLLATFWKFF